MPHPPKGESASYRVHSMGRCLCPCGCMSDVWRIEYVKGEPVFEDDYGTVHRAKQEVKPLPATKAAPAEVRLF